MNMFVYFLAAIGGIGILGLIGLLIAAYFAPFEKDTFIGYTPHDD